MAEYVAQAYLQIDGRTIHCNSIAIDSSNSDGIVTPMNRRRRGTGYFSTVPTYGFTANVPTPTDGHTVDLWGYYQDRAPFTAYIEYEGGHTKTFMDCRITGISENADGASAVESAITCIALDMLATG